MCLYRFYVTSRNAPADRVRAFTQQTGSNIMILARIATAALTATLVIAGVQAHAAGEPKGAPTVVLVHGAFADSSSWNGVAERLKGHGLQVIAAANPLRGVADDARYVSSIVDSIPGPVVLVGHSYGGAVITNVATQDPKVKALVYVAA